MEYVDPIRDINKINAIKRNLQQKSPRDFLLFVIGINTGIRVSDLLSLKVGDVVTVEAPAGDIKLKIIKISK